MAKIILRDLSDNSARNKASRFDIFEGIGSPEGAVVGKVGDLYVRRDGGRGTTLYFKESGHDTNTGWIENINTYGPLSHNTAIFLATGGETEFTLPFAITNGDPIIVTKNGVTVDDGHDITLDYNANKIYFNEPLKPSARIKVFKISGNESSANDVAKQMAIKYAIALG